MPRPRDAGRLEPDRDEEWQVTPSEVEAFRRDGAVVLRGLCRDWIAVIEAGLERNMKEPGPFAMESTRAGEPGRFSDDYCNGQRIPEFRRVIEDSPIARTAALAMGSRSAQFFHDHVLVKEPGTAKPPPWHQDSPYYFVEGSQTVSFWIPVDPVLPVRWLDDTNFYAEAADYRPVPDPDRDPSMRVVAWDIEPGDAVLFDFRMVHGAHGNPHGVRRRVLSLRRVGDDARYVERPGRTSPPYPGHETTIGRKLREDWFAVIWRGSC